MNLLPGLPDEITLDQITPKLPWRTLPILSWLSRSWRQAIQSRLVYDARVRAHSTETLIVHTHYHGETEPRAAIALYSTSDKRCYELPPIPDLQRGIAGLCQCVSLDGKIYVLGGEDPRYGIACEEVYVLDVAGHRQWEQCASMEEPRENFGSGVVQGKIYVFGGANFLYPAGKSEVYDPKVNAWSPIMPMKSWRDGHLVAAVGEELFVSGGNITGPDYFVANGRKNVPNWWDWLDHKHFVEVYNTVKNEWRIIHAPVFWPVFMAKGNLHGMFPDGIHTLQAYENDEYAWVMRLPYSFAGIGPTDPSAFLTVRTDPPLVVNDELFIRVHWECNDAAQLSLSGSELLQCIGFENENVEISWQQTNCSFDVESPFEGSVMYAMHL